MVHVSLIWSGKWSLISVPRAYSCCSGLQLGAQHFHYRQFFFGGSHSHDKCELMFFFFFLCRRNSEFSLWDGGCIFPLESYIHLPEKQEYTGYKKPSQVLILLNECKWWNRNGTVSELKKYQEDCKGSYLSWITSYTCQKGLNIVQCLSFFQTVFPWLALLLQQTIVNLFCHTDFMWTILKSQDSNTHFKSVKKRN